ncbi:MAG: PBP1A family penicillin-binding protein [Deltaproteobacteria bacterium]|nr:PBP1A family penicillin-binding protein [Deltaproteobacteria bacterium]
MLDKIRKLTWTFYLKAALICFLLGFIVVSIITLAILKDLPSVDSIRPYRPTVASEVYSKEMVKIGEYYKQRRFFVPLSEMPATLAQAFVSAEDASFYEHGGISFIAIFRAMIKNIQAGYKKQGGSTITQQVARALLLSPEKKYSRKIKEIFLSYFMEHFFSKNDILEMYLNQVYLGNSAYGVQAASEVYFGKDLGQMTIAEMAMIAGLTKAPSRDNPKKDYEKAKARQLYVLKRLLEEDKITEAEYDQAIVEEITIKKGADLNNEIAPYFVEYIRTYLMDKYGAQKVLEEGLQVYTTLQIKPALAATTALQNGIESIDQHQGYRGVIKNIAEADRENFINNTLAQQHISDTGTLQALVLALDDEAGWVHLQLGIHEGLMLLEHYHWARKPDPEQYWKNHLIKKPSQVFQTGDVIWVKAPYESVAKPKNLPENLVSLPMYSLYQTPTVQGSLIAMDPINGEMVAMVGGYDFQSSEFNRALHAKRQPGSAFKPFIYAAALDSGYTAASIINDAPLVYDDPTNEFTWKPKNYGGKFYGDTIFRDCLIQSRNIPTIKILQDIGIDKAIDYAKRMGITSDLERNFSLALGSSSVTALEMVTAYAVFASGGRKTTPFMITKVVDRDGKVLESNANVTFQEDLAHQIDRVFEQRFEQQKIEQIAEIGRDPQATLPDPYVLSPQTAFITTNLLSEVITSGTGRRAISLGRPAAGKTGTTNDNLDAWFVGYTPGLVAAVWIGNDDRKPLGILEGGGATATPIWLDFMQGALEEKPKKDFFTPPGLTYVQIDPETGKLATEKTARPVFEVFREDTQPQQYSTEDQQNKQAQDFFLTE